MQLSMLDCSTEILWIIASAFQGGDISTLARTNPTLYPKLRLTLIEHNIRHQNSAALHWAAKASNRTFSKTLLSYRADVDAMVNDFSPLMTAAKHGSERVTDLLLRKRKTRVNMRNANGMYSLWQVQNINLGLVMMPGNGTNDTHSPLTLHLRFLASGIQSNAKQVPTPFVMPVPKSWLHHPIRLMIRAESETHYAFFAAPKSRPWDA